MISTLAELKTAVANWTHRDDLTDRLDEFVALGEVRLNRRLRLLQMETALGVALAPGAESAPLPAGFLDLITVCYSDTKEVPAQITEAERNACYDPAPGRPERFAVGNTFLFNRPASTAYTLTVRHHRKWTLVTSGTNWLVQNYPDAYLFATLTEAEAYAKNFDEAAAWDGRLKELADELNRQDARVKGRAPLRADVALRTAPPDRILYG